MVPLLPGESLNLLRSASTGWCKIGYSAHPMIAHLEKVTFCRTNCGNRKGPGAHLTPFDDNLSGREPHYHLITERSIL